MKQIANFFKNRKFLVLNLVCIMLAVFTGGAFAMAAGVHVAEEGAPAAGADKSVDNMDAPGIDGQGKQNAAGQSLAGTAASATQLHGGGLAEDEYDEIISKFRPFQFPLDTDIRKEASQKKVSGMEVTHIQSGSESLDCEVTVQIETADEISLTKSNISGKLSMFPECSTILVQDVNGYRDNSDSIKEGDLVLYVTKNDGTNVICQPLNGPAKVDGEPAMTCPVIPVGTQLSVMANGCSESQMIVSPDNFQPRTKKVYLQKKILNVVLTDQFAKQIKKYPFFEEDVKGEALYKFRRRCARTAWIGKQKRITVIDDKMGEEFVYFSEGVLRQVTMLMGSADVFDLPMLTAINMLMYTEYASGNVGRAYCGKNFIRRLLHLKENKSYKELGFKSYNNLGIEVHAYKDNFGTTEFVYDPTLDDLGYSDFACVIDIKHARRYVETENREYTIDMKMGAGENREAKRNVTIIADAIALKGYNSLLIGPSEMLNNRNLADAAVNVALVSQVPENPVDGQLIFLTVNDESKGLTKDKAYKYEASSQTWKPFNGTVTSA